MKNIVNEIKHSRVISNFKNITSNGITIKHLGKVVIYYAATDSDRYINYFLVDELKKVFYISDYFRNTYLQNEFKQEFIDIINHQINKYNYIIDYD